MKEITEKDLAWRKGFEAGVAFTLRNFIVTGITSHGFTKFITDLYSLRPWKTYEDLRRMARIGT